MIKIDCEVICQICCSTKLACEPVDRPTLPRSTDYKNNLLTIYIFSLQYIETCNEVCQDAF